MITIKKNPDHDKPEKRYRIIDVAKATGLSEGQVQGYFSNRDISTKAGLTLEQIEAMALSGKRGPGINWKDVQEIRTRLDQERGVIIAVEDGEF